MNAYGVFSTTDVHDCIEKHCAMLKYDYINDLL